MLPQSYVLVAGEVKQSIEKSDLEQLLYFTVRYRNAEKLLIAEDYYTLTNQVLVDRIATMGSRDVGRMVSQSWKYYLDVKAAFIHDSIRSKALSRAIDLAILSSPEEWLDLRKAYASLYKDDLVQVMRRTFAQDTFASRLLLAWIAFRRTPRSTITEDIMNLYAAATGETVGGAAEPDGAATESMRLQDTASPKKAKGGSKGTSRGAGKGTASRGPDWDYIIKILGTTMPQEWHRIYNGFERRYKMSLASMLQPHMTPRDYNTFRVASSVLYDIVQGIACLLHVYLGEKDVQGAMALISMYCDKCNNLRLEYQKFGSLADDMARAMVPDTCHACLKLLQMPQ